MDDKKTRPIRIVKTRTVKIVVTDAEWNRFKIEALVLNETVQSLMSKMVMYVEKSTNGLFYDGSV